MRIGPALLLPWILLWPTSTGLAQEVVALSGEASPNGAAYVRFLQFEANQLGQAVFVAQLEDGSDTVQFYHGVRVRQLASTQVPIAGQHVSELRRPAVGDNGDVAFVGKLPGSRWALFHQARSSGPTMVCREGDLIDETEIASVRQPILANGVLFFTAHVTGDVGPWALFRVNGDEITRVVASGDPAGAGRVGVGSEVKCRAGSIYFINSAKVGPPLMLAPTGIVRVDGATAPIVSRFQQISGGGSLESDIGGKGIRSFDLLPNGSVLFIADVIASRSAAGVVRSEELLVSTPQAPSVGRFGAVKTGTRHGPGRSGDSREHGVRPGRQD